MELFGNEELTPENKYLVGKLIVVQRVNKFRVFMEPRI
jgi:hypothetical protein